MARASYSLNEYATSTIESMNGTTYTVTLWWNGTGAANTWTLGPAGFQISYESEKIEDKNSPILTSVATLPVMVENLTQQNFLEGIRTDKQERDVWLTLKTGSAHLWSGYVLIDMEAQQDVSYPYEVTLTAVDGLASLKEIPFLRETNTITGAVPTYPYVKQDTWVNAGFQKIINSASSWIKILLDEAGQLLESDDADTGSPQITDYYIQTAFNWWNEDMDVSPSATEDPLANMRINMEPFYNVGTDGFYSVPNCYDVLKSICINFNMRLVYWKSTFHFIGIDEYNTDEQGSAPYTSPINIPTREYYYTGTARTDRNYIGSTNYSLYKMIFENATNTGKGLEKLAGSTYQALPAIKTVEGTYQEEAGNNLFRGFPLFVTGNLVDGLPTAWDTTGNTVYYKQLPQMGAAGYGYYTTMEVSNAADLDGFVCALYLDFENTTNGWLEMETVWTIRAKPVDSAWGDGDNKVMYRRQYSTYAQLEWQAYEFPLANNQQYVYEKIWIPTTAGGAPAARVTIFDSATNQTTNTKPFGGDNDGFIPTHADFTGRWELQFYTFTEFDSNAAAPMRAYNQGNANYSHGRVVDMDTTGQLNFDSSATAEEQVPTSYALNYTDAVNMNLTPPFESFFTPISSGAISFGTAEKKMEVTQDTSDSYIYDIGDIKFGDGTGSNTYTTIQVLDSSGDWIFVNYNGKWAKGVYTWGGSSYSYASPTYNKTLLTLLSESILNNQSKSLLTLGTTSALSVNDKFYSGSSKLKFMIPIAKLNAVEAKEYIIMRATFSLSTDECSGDFVQINYSVPTTVLEGTRDIRSSG